MGGCVRGPLRGGLIKLPPTPFSRLYISSFAQRVEIRVRLYLQGFPGEGGGEVQREGPPGTGISQKAGPRTAINHCLRRTAVAPGGFRGDRGGRGRGE